MTSFYIYELDCEIVLVKCRITTFSGKPCNITRILRVIYDPLSNGKEGMRMALTLHKYI